MGRPNEECSPGQQACVLDVAVCLAVAADAASASGSPSPQSEISTNAAAMNLVFIPNSKPASPS